MKDHSYLGSGKLFVREYGAAAPFVEVGNVSALTFSPQTNTITLADHTQPGGGERNRVDRLTGVEVAYTFHDFAPQNFARALRGNVKTDVAGNVADEPAVAYRGGFIPLARIANAITSVKAGNADLQAGEDYIFQDGGLFIPVDSKAPEVVDGAPNITVTYTSPATATVQALVNASKQYEMLFHGLNEAQSGKPVRVRAHKVSGGVMAQLSLIGEEYGAGEVSGALMSDTGKGEGLSKYFVVQQEVIA